MKKITHLFSIIAACVPFVMLAQPTITSADFPTVTSKWAELNDTRTGAHIVTAGGANLNWDYSLGYFAVTDTSFVSFMLPSSVPNGWGSNYPTSDLAEYSSVDSSAQFFELNTNGILYDGQYDGAKNGFGKIDYTPDLYFIPTPFTYNSTKSNTSKLTAFGKVSSFNAKIIRHVIQAIKGDAYGTMKTPAGTFSNTLRFHTFSYAYDSIFVDYLGNGSYTLVSSSGPADSTNNYMWYSAAQKAPVAMVDFIGPASKSVADGAKYFNFTLQPVISVNELSATKWSSIYPNPAINQPVLFSMDANSGITNIAVYNVNGQLVRSEQIAGSTQVLLQTNELNAGLYFYSLTDKNGKQMQTGKFVVGK